MMSQNILLLSWTHSQQAIRRSVTTKKKQQNKEREREREEDLSIQEAEDLTQQKKEGNF